MSTDLDFRQLQELAAEILGTDPEKVQLDVSFARDLAADSLDLVELIMAIEETYGVKLPEEELARMHQIKDLWAYLQAHEASASGEPPAASASAAS